MKIHIILITLLLAFTCQAQPLVLSQKECREMALTHSEDIKISSNNILQAKLDRKVASNSLLPQLSGSAMGMYMLPDMDFRIKSHSADLCRRQNRIWNKARQTGCGGIA